MEPSTTSKLPPDVTKVGRRKSANNNFSDTQSLRRQATPAPNGPLLTSGQLKVSQIRRPRRKLTEEPIDSISIESHKSNHVTQHKTTTEFTHLTEASQVTGSNGVTTTPKGNPGSESCADNSSPSLWMRKTPEEIVDYYRQLGPNWRNEFEKTDLTYSPSSPWYNKEVVPGSGIPVIPNMSREPVGVYARTLRNRKKTAVDLNSYAVEVGRPGDHYLSHDRRTSLAYGLTHSPSTHHSTPTSRVSYPSHAYPQNNRHLSSNYSSSSFSSSALISRTHHVITSSVTMVTKLFTLVFSMLSLAWIRRNESSLESEGVDTVDNAYQHYQHHGVQNYEYKTGAKRSSLHHRASSGVASSHSYLSSSYHLIYTTVYSVTTWLIETSARVFWLKDRSVETAVPSRVRDYVKYGVLAIVLLLFGVWLFSPLNSDAINSTESTASPEQYQPSDSDLSPPWTSTLSYLTTPISSTAHLLQTSLSTCIISLSNALYATGQFIAFPFNSIFYGTGSLLTIPSRALNYLSVPFSGAANVLSTIPSSLAHYASIPVHVASEGVSKGVTYGGDMVYFLGQMLWTVLYSFWTILWGSIQTVSVISGGWVSSLKASTVPAYQSAEMTPSVSTQQPGATPMKQEEKKQQAPPPPPVPSVEEIVLRVLSDVRFQSMVEQNVKISVEKSGEKEAHDKETREKELQEKVTELCSRLVESELSKYKSSVMKEQETQQRLQSTIPAPVTVTDNEEVLRYKAQVDDMIRQIQSLETEQQTSFLDLMTKFSGLIDDKIRAAFAVYDADRTGLTDYALESAGGAVVNIRCTETYTLKDPYYVLFGFALWKRESSPRKAIQPGLLPGDCWAFKGAVGCLILKLSHRIKVTKFSMEHIPRALTPSGEIDSAPNKFTVWGLAENTDSKPTFLGEFAYDNDGPTLQYFDALDTPETFNMVELKISSNHGNIEYTCLYRFRVHGSLTPPSSPSAPDYQIPPSMAANHNTYHHHSSAADVKYNPV